jgi:hypothetical protein
MPIQYKIHKGSIPGTWKALANSPDSNLDDSSGTRSDQALIALTIKAIIGFDDPSLLAA